MKKTKPIYFVIMIILLCFILPTMSPAQPGYDSGRHDGRDKGRHDRQLQECIDRCYHRKNKCVRHSRHKKHCYDELYRCKNKCLHKFRGDGHWYDDRGQRKR
ncbi:hypothetical protein DO021_01215 [Desulfobacter hydrogenophilus]|uniref:Uncharacterized protein n=1 Tax=Desulfobacter hydrogenophilus TaxID=2291 RepID=A0A328FL57_9BACT|nr:hypothetical protein [Desulfobacter hydrogenophilus]NDY71756.1 hypothetical protein [Desulfobacter hydrogenophilus]QBH13454.1 hypothetical protein EYB58_11285 [Desulfobacter hydrogenophilus]RAM03705.1 hypothetical protein DO021_01215 [Desulfobacter hydrogenophilus]